MLRAELHNIEGTGWFSALENTNPAEVERDWNLFSLMASYRF